jgi:hypothetical protein
MSFVCRVDVRWAGSTVGESVVEVVSHVSRAVTGRREKRVHAR